MQNKQLWKATTLIILVLAITGVIIVLGALFWKFSFGVACDENQIGDGFCNDNLNTAECIFDQGDCCLTAPESQNHCSLCICHATQGIIIPSQVITQKEPAEPFSTFSTDGTSEASTAPAELSFIATTSTTPFLYPITTAYPANGTCPKSHNAIGDGLCDDHVNHEACDFDGGDCCTPFIHENFCEICSCKQDGTRHPTYPPSSVVLVVSCYYPDQRGDGICDDDLNWKPCGYDGGDCCYGIKLLCSRCICFTDVPNCEFLAYLNDGECDDLANSEQCQYDGGDCCQDEIDASFCQDCICHLDGLKHTVGCHSPSWAGDGYCDDENNNQNCNFDEGDCCLQPINTMFCKECLCKE